MTVVSGLEIPPELSKLPVAKLRELVYKANPGVWSEQKRGFRNAAVHWEWYGLIPSARRLAVVAPREHAKTECFTINATVWRSLYFPGTWTYIFANTIEQAQELKERIDRAMEEVEPQQLHRARTVSKRESQYLNGSRVTVAGAGKAVRGAHPDVIIGDDVLEESTAMSQVHRERIERWWKGTISGMAHPGTTRVLPGGKKVRMTGTRVFLVGTPFHPQDLLMSMASNPMYQFRRYAAEYGAADLVDGLAVQVA